MARRRSRPANTFAASRRSAHGVDLVELDVLGLPDRTLVLGHSHRELDEEPATLEDVFALLREQSPETEAPGRREGGRARARVRRGLAQVRPRRADGGEHRTGSPRCALCGGSSPACAQPDLSAETGSDLGTRRSCRCSAPVRAGRAPDRCRPHRRRSSARRSVGRDALHHELVTRAAVERCHALGVAVFAWTVNDRVVSAARPPRRRRRRSHGRSSYLPAVRGYTSIVKRLVLFAVGGARLRCRGCVRGRRPRPAASARPALADHRLDRDHDDRATTTTPPPALIPPGVTISGIAVGGLSPEEATTIVQERFDLPLRIVLDRSSPARADAGRAGRRARSSTWRSSARGAPLPAKR